MSQEQKFQENLTKKQEIKKFSQKLDENLVNKEFFLLKNNFKSLQDIKIYCKIIDNVGYVIIPLEESKSYKELFKEATYILEVLQKKQKLNSIILVKMLVGYNLVGEELIYLNQQLIFDSKVISLVWGINVSDKNIITKSNQPKKFMGIENIVKSSLNNELYVETKKDKKIKKLAILSTNTSYTYLVIYILALIFGLVYDTKDTYILNFGLSPTLIQDGQYYRLFTAMFLHTNLTHLLSNGLSLYIFGTRVEKFLGKQFFLIVYIFGGIIGSIASVAFTQAISIGASGAIYALEGATFYFIAKNKVALDGINFHLMFILTIFGLAIGFTESNVDVAGHIGGFLAGIIMCAFYNIGYKKKYIKRYKI
ncbi:MAG: rhomboid family intramembrane serine protease [bacterium]